MKQSLAIIIGVTIIAGLVVSVFTAQQVHQQKNLLISDTEQYTRLLTNSLKESIEPYYLVNSIDKLQKTVDKFISGDLVGITVYNSNGRVVTVSADTSKDMPDNSRMIDSVISSDKSSGEFVRIQNSRIYIFAEPLHNEDNSVAGVLLVMQRADYIDRTINQIWLNNLFGLLIQVIIFSLIGIVVLKWIILKPLSILIRSIRSGHSNKMDHELNPVRRHLFFRPLVDEIYKMASSLQRARSVASEEARLRLEKTDAPWTEEHLKEFTKAYLKDQQIFLVFNREPYSHEKGKNGIYCFSQAGGVLTALEPLMEACGGMWIAHGSGNADKEVVDENDKIKVPPDNPKYTLKRVWLTDKEVKGYNKGYSAEGLYPLCLNTYTRPIFREEDWAEYKKVNGKFAKVLLSEIKNVQRPIIIVNEYHFALLPRMIKASRPDARIGIFWHTPWPNAEAFNICPQRKQILEGMLGADVIGFHNQQFCNNFIDTIGKNVESLIDFDKFSITRDEHTSYIKSFPVGVVFTNDQESEDSSLLVRKILDRLKIKTKYLGLGVDRLDYVKGIPERFKGIEYFFDTHPDYREQLTFLQIASPCRSEIEKYLEYKGIVSREAERINKKFRTEEWQPIVLEMAQYSHEDLNLLYKFANVCVITSLNDGMNLVSKEYVAERNDELGVLILSQFTGASHELKGALVVNPYSTKEIADAIYKGITMSPLEQKRRMKTMRNSVKNYNIYRWAAELLKAIAEF